MQSAAHHAVDGAGALFVLLVVLPGVLLAAYLVAAVRARKAAGWSGWRTASFTAGIGLILAAMSPSVAEWAHQDLRGHMLQHLLLGMFAPLALVLGAPGLLLLRNVSARVARRIVTVLGSIPVRVLIHPVSAALLNIGGMYLLYLTPLYALSLHHPAVNVLVHVHFVLAGYLFAWSIAGPDPAPHRPGMRLRLGVLFTSVAMHANLGKILYGYGFPRGTGNGWRELQSAAQWMYYGGDIAELLLIVAFFAGWVRRLDNPFFGSIGVVATRSQEDRRSRPPRICGRFVAAGRGVAGRLQSRILG